MPSVWSEIKEYWQWFLWGKTPYNQLSDQKKQEARRDLYCRLFVIANAPFFVTFYCTHKLSMIFPMFLLDTYEKLMPEGGNWRKKFGGFTFGIYVVLHCITGTAALVFIVAPWYLFVFNCFHSLTGYIFSK
ncbi:unnamed protein product [Caenorhabditis brenneri]